MSSQDRLATQCQWCMQWCMRLIMNDSSRPSLAPVLMCCVTPPGQVYVCAPEVLMLFTDNFDYQVR